MDTISQIKQKIEPVSYYSKELSNFSDQNKARAWVLSGLCPFHADTKTGSFNIHRETGAYNCFSCGAKGGDILHFHSQKYNLSIIDAIKALNGDGTIYASSNNQKQSAPRVQAPDKNMHLCKKKIEEILSNSVDLKSAAASPARLYLQKRGLGDVLEDLPDDLLFNPSAIYVDEIIKSDFPCLLGVVRNEANEIVTLHRTYLTNDGEKAPVKNPKKLMPVSCDGGMSGSAVKLYKPKDKIGVCEGIETALAARLITSVPIWSAISSVFLSQLKIPPDIKKVIIFSDNDSSESGQKAAQKLASSLIQEGRMVKIFVPKKPNNE